MKRLALITLWISQAAAALAAVNLTLRDGETLVAEKVAPQGSRLQVTLAGQGARTVDISSIVRIDMSEPASYTEAREAYLAGDTLKTLSTMGRLRAELEPLKNIPGAREWWLESEFLRAHILLSQRRFKEVESSMKEIAADEKDSAAAQHARAFLAHLTGLEGDPRKAAEQIREVIQATTDPDALADAWMFAGEHLAAQGNQREALLAYLRIPVFYPGREVSLAGARLGAARAYLALEDPIRARQSLRDLLSQLPNTPQAPEARRLLTQVERDLGLESSETSPASTEEKN